MISSLWPWALGPSILPYCFILATIALFFLLWAYWPSFLPCQPILLLYFLGFLGPFTSSLHLFTLMGLLLNSLGLLGPFTLSLPLITLMGLLAIIHVMSTHFTTLFFGLPRPIYFFFTSFYSYGLTTSFIGHHRPVYFFFTSCYFHGPTGYQSCHSSPLGLFPYFFTILPLIFFLSFLLLGFFCCQALCQNGHQQHVQCMWKFKKKIVYNSTYIFN